MQTFEGTIKSADWKAEKHSPLIEAPATVAKGVAFTINASVGKEIRHPNTTEHFINWIALYFQPTGSGALINLGRADFSAHGESSLGPNQGPALTEPYFSTKVSLATSGTLLAMSYCNIHGLWQSSTPITVE